MVESKAGTKKWSFFAEVVPKREEKERKSELNQDLDPVKSCKNAKPKMRFAHGSYEVNIQIPKSPDQKKKGFAEVGKDMGAV